MEVVFNEGLVNVLHGRNEKRRRVMWVNKDFVADSNGFDFRGRVVGDDVLFDPCVGEGEAFGGGEEEFVGQIDGDFNARAGNGSENGRIGVVNLDPLKGVGFEEVNDLDGGREIVGDSAIVDTNGTSLCNNREAWGEEEEEEDEEEGEG